jgi:predicted NBD/HSP70 family sugar kinase
MKSTIRLSDINLYRVLHIVWEHKGISRIEIASKLALNKSTITKHIAELKRMGLIHEITEGSTGPLGGRKPIFLEITPNYGIVGGIEITSEKFVCCILNLHGDILYQYQEIIEPEDLEKQNIKQTLQIAYNLLMLEAKKKNIPLLGIGIGLPALVNTDTGVIIQSVPLNIQTPYNFMKEIEDIISIPFCIENDARCCCYTEQHVSAISPKNMLFLLLEYSHLEILQKTPRKVSIGMGLVLNGHIFRGSESIAGEFRSTLWEGNTTGQLKASFSEPISNNTQNEQAYKELAKHVAFLVNILNLTTVLIGGNDLNSAITLSKAITKEIDFLWPYSPKKNVVIKIASLGNLSVAYGAASMFLERLFPFPKIYENKKDRPTTLDLLALIKTKKIKTQVIS